MDFDDLDETEEIFGPDPGVLHDELLANAKPPELPHPKPEGLNFGKRGYMKMLYLTSMGSNEKMGMMQVNNLLANAPRKETDTVLDWTVLEGPITNSFQHQNPEVAAMYEPYGPDFYTYFMTHPYNLQDEMWTGFDESVQKLGDHLKKHGPYDGIMGFDLGACLALEAARLAQEGVPAFSGKFRFLIVCSGHMFRALSTRGTPQETAKRPRAPLRLPTFFTYSDECLVRPPTAYEESTLYIDPAYRQLCKHRLGHIPPKFDKDTEQLKLLCDFIDKMHYGLVWEPVQNVETAAVRNLWLPLARAAPPAPLSSGALRRILVVHDPLGQHGPTGEELRADTRRPWDEDREQAVKRVDLLRQVRGTTAKAFRDAVSADGLSNVSVEEIVYLPAHVKRDDWHPKVHRRAAWVDPEDEVLVPWKDSMKIASEALEGPREEDAVSVIRGDAIALVGIGTGGHVARALAEVLARERSITPLGLWLIASPTIAPMEAGDEIGGLLNCPVRYLTPPIASNGPPWRIELASLGPFSHGVFDDVEGMVAMVLKEMQEAGAA